MIIICDIGVNSKTGSVYKIPIVDPDHIHILNTVGNRLLAGSEKIIPRTDGKKERIVSVPARSFRTWLIAPSPPTAVIMFPGFLYLRTAEPACSGDA